MSRLGECQTNPKNSSVPCKPWKNLKAGGWLSPNFKEKSLKNETKDGLDGKIYLEVAIRDKNLLISSNG